ncbi:MAG: hypothetical protein OXE99_04825, partial [Cellvibrionales bacterium]|nr:hypothetical protein [Cellvibrionales bacterium]
GAVRDLLLGAKPRDYDIITTAIPKQLRKAYKIKYINASHPVYILRIGRHDIEISCVDKPCNHEQSFLLDTLRRDCTINAMYFNPLTKSLLDPLNAYSDIQNRIVRFIDHDIVPTDPIRIIRALHLSAKTGFSIEDKTSCTIRTIRRNANIKINANKLTHYLKRVIFSGHAADTFKLFKQYNIRQPFILLTPNNINDKALLSIMQKMDADSAKSLSNFYLYLLEALGPTCVQEAHKALSKVFKTTCCLLPKYRRQEYRNKTIQKWIKAS